MGHYFPIFCFIFSGSNKTIHACDYESLGYNKGEIIAIVKAETTIAETNALLPLTSKRDEMDVRQPNERPAPWNEASTNSKSTAQLRAEVAECQARVVNHRETLADSRTALVRLRAEWTKSVAISQELQFGPQRDNSELSAALRTAKQDLHFYSMQELKVDHDGQQLNEAQRTLQEVILALGRREGPGSAWHEKNASVDPWQQDPELPRSRREVEERSVHSSEKQDPKIAQAAEISEIEVKLQRKLSDLNVIAV